MRRVTRSQQRRTRVIKTPSQAIKGDEESFRDKGSSVLLEIAGSLMIVDI